MGYVEYFYLNLEDNAPYDSVLDNAGGIFEILIDHLGFEGDKAVRLFISSGLAQEFERRNAVYVSGKSSSELVLWMFERVGMEQEVPDGLQVGFSTPYWIGEMAAAFQIANGITYQRLFECVPYQRFCELHASYGELTPTELDGIIKDIIESQPFKSPLKMFRKRIGMTQAELASRSGVSIRSIQQYEQGAKDIHKAAADSVYKLSIILGCRIEDLL